MLTSSSTSKIHSPRSTHLRYSVQHHTQQFQDSFSVSVISLWSTVYAGTSKLLWITVNVPYVSKHDTPFPDLVHHLSKDDEIVPNHFIHTVRTSIHQTPYRTVFQQFLQSFAALPTSP